MARKKRGAHHGGAWKVAYADFVTAMMALFMVLWIVGQDEEIVLAAADYFRNPFGSPLDAQSGLFDEKRGHPDARMPGENETDAARDTNNMDVVFLNSVAQDFYRLLNMDEEMDERPIDIQVTSDGIRITLYDRQSEPLFLPFSAEFTEWGRFAMQNLAWVIARHRFNVVIEGHTPQGFEMPEEQYTVWELSADRANAARRMLTRYAVEESQTARVVGLADRLPIPELPPDSESNQRVTLSLTPANRSAHTN